ncbi:MAG: isopeptide-forming domain-containing fimbrial protein [Clostridia bacterium]
MGGSVKRSGFDPLQRLLLSTLLLAVLFFGSTATCYGATLKTIPSTNLSVAYSNKLLLGYHNYTATWSGVSGKMIKGKYNYDLLCVPIKTKTGSFTYTDFLDLNFTNVGKINGRQIDAKVHFNSMTVGKRNASGERGDNYFAVCYLADESMWMSSTIAGIGAGYRAPKTIDITTTMYWHDTGKVVNLPFFQCLSDIDAGANYFKEAWEAKSGFSGIFYKYSPCFLRFSGNRAATPKATDVGGNDSLWKAGFYAPTTGGTFRGVFTEGNCATQFMPYSAYTMMSNPVKSSDSRDRNVEGDEIDYTITQKIGKFYVDTMTPYSSLVMTDRLPEGLSYQSAAIYDGSGRDITSRGSLSYDESSRTVSFTMGASWLASIDNYSGQTLCLKIETRVDPVESPLKTVKNYATTTIDKDVKLTSNEICDTLAIPYHVKYEYICGTKGRKLPKEISTQSGAYQVSDESAYYQGDMVKRKDTPKDGTVYKVVDGDGEEKGSWVLQWDAETQKIEQSDVTFTGTWRYVPAPRLVIEKSISLQSDQLTEAHGAPCFLFRITGASSGKVWYRSVSFRSDSVAKAKTAADGSEKIYRDQDGNMFQIDGDVLRASCPAIRLPEDDYLVEELDPLRFRAVQSESGYVGDFGWQQTDTGADSAKISLRLSQLRPGEEGYDASYAKVSFKNEKIDWSWCSHTDLIINMLKKEAKR